ncbi:oligoendopeptidase F [Atopobacter phocae]|uniref:oligoendopeptidase F n=1 Tax=Atopobacter phocae TaxID=136492 RepID=UPI00047003BC|nr:oligoendopeptidase F [Atopobacter phocae]
MTQTNKPNTILSREEVPLEFTWDLTSVYTSDEEMEKDLSHVKDQIKTFEELHTDMTSSPEQLARILDLQAELLQVIERAYVYSSMKFDQDTTNPTYQSLRQRALDTYIALSSATSFINPEILNMDADQLTQWVEESKELNRYKQLIDQLLKQKNHVLSSEMESMLAEAEGIFGGASQTFGALMNADLDFGEVENEEGEMVPLTHGSYGTLIQSKDRATRERVYQQLYRHIKGVINTLAQTIGTQVKKQNYLAKMHHYQSAREASLSKNDITEEVYDILVQQVNEHLPLLHRYIALRKKALGLEKVRMSDMYVSLDKATDDKLSFEEARSITLKALEPLGDDYQAILNEGFNNRWIDVYENKGKRSGAYSSGAYDTNPFILLNWQDDLMNLFTLVHEFGHSAHSYYTRNNQPFIYGDYSIFLAEIASTTNENLLTEYLLEKETDPVKRLNLLNNYIDRFKSTIFRQTQFAEFEQLIHEADQKGEALTVDHLSKLYADINKRYYGPDVEEDAMIQYEWARIPHFYYNFYVYQYATGMAAATTLASHILNDGEEAVERYKTYLKAGRSDYPIEIMKRAGVDMTTKDYLVEAFAVFEKRLNELEEVINELS